MIRREYRRALVAEVEELKAAGWEVAGGSTFAAGEVSALLYRCVDDAAPPRPAPSRDDIDRRVEGVAELLVGQVRDTYPDASVDAHLLTAELWAKRVAEALRRRRLSR